MAFAFASVPKGTMRKVHSRDLLFQVNTITQRLILLHCKPVCPTTLPNPATSCRTSSSPYSAPPMNSSSSTSAPNWSNSAVRSCCTRRPSAPPTPPASRPRPPSRRPLRSARATGHASYFLQGLPLGNVMARSVSAKLSWVGQQCRAASDSMAALAVFEDTWVRALHQWGVCLCQDSRKPNSMPL